MRPSAAAPVPRPSGRGPNAMRLSSLLAALLLAACAKPLPEGLERVAAKDGQGFTYSSAAGMLAFVEGRFPSRTLLVVVDLATGARRARRVTGWSLGGKTALARDGRRVVVEAGKISAYASRSEPVQRAFLLIDAESGAVLAEQPLGAAGVVAFAHPSWSADPVVVWNDKGGPRWKAIGGEAGGQLPGPPAWSGILTDAGLLFAAEKKTTAPRLIAYDMRSGKQTGDWRSELSVAPLAARADGSVLAARWAAESGGFLLEACDSENGRREALLESEGEIESAVETHGALYAIAKDHSRKNDSGKSFLAPRSLLVLERGGARWSVPWTSHAGDFLGFDPERRRLWFAVTDRDKPGAWSIALNKEALSAAGPAIDAY